VLHGSAVTPVRDQARDESPGAVAALIGDARAGGYDAEAVVGLRTELADLSTRAVEMNYEELLTALLDLAYGGDLNREITGVSNIARAVFGYADPRTIARVKKFERDGLCTFRRWRRSIYLLQGDVRQVRLELQARGKLPEQQKSCPQLSPRLRCARGRLPSSQS